MEKIVDYTYATILGFLAIFLFAGVIGNAKIAAYKNSPEYISEITKNCENVAKEKNYNFFTIIKRENPEKDDFCYLAKNNGGYPDIRIPVINGFVEKSIFQKIKS